MRKPKQILRDDPMTALAIEAAIRRDAHLTSIEVATECDEELTYAWTPSA